MTIRAVVLQLQLRAMVHESVDDLGGHTGVALIFPTVLHHAVEGHTNGAAHFLALVHDGLRDFGGVFADTLGQEQVIQDEHVWVQLF